MADSSVTMESIMMPIVTGDLEIRLAAGKAHRFQSVWMELLIDKGDFEKETNTSALPPKLRFGDDTIEIRGFAVDDEVYLKPLEFALTLGDAKHEFRAADARSKAKWVTALKKYVSAPAQRRTTSATSGSVRLDCPICGQKLEAPAGAPLVRCTCGQTLRVEQSQQLKEFRVACPACQRHLIYYEGTLQFLCPCGQLCQAPPEHVQSMRVNKKEAEEVVRRRAAGASSSGSSTAPPPTTTTSTTTTSTTTTSATTAGSGSGGGSSGAPSSAGTRQVVPSEEASPFTFDNVSLNGSAAPGPVPTATTPKNWVRFGVESPRRQARTTSQAVPPSPSGGVFRGQAVPPKGATTATGMNLILERPSAPTSARRSKPSMSHNSMVPTFDLLDLNAPSANSTPAPPLVANNGEAPFVLGAPPQTRTAAASGAVSNDLLSAFGGGGGGGNTTGATGGSNNPFAGGGGGGGGGDDDWVAFTVDNNKGFDLLS